MDEIALPGGQCEANLVLKWMTEVSSAIYATPLITDLYSDSFKDIIVPSFVHYTEVHYTLPSSQQGCACLGPFIADHTIAQVQMPGRSQDQLAHHRRTSRLLI